MMYDHEKSDPAIVAVKPTNKRYFLATMDENLIKEMKQAGIAIDKSASECLEIAAKERLARREMK
ncbi:hypothetical protein [Bradyrhizobium sp. Ash2021]|uniref:hypothetical protein n=1 Tax=Bradyrhizobium sp. Ash2021 TaxID=2954771 RepID=UPI002815BE48|nr:hypothetical protein [Bradyrhizobium sp. Ash2021]WMT70950.1 hypothetical protein NL528_22800 [Bradyrhizobium sp. Ash2021]